MLLSGDPTPDPNHRSPQIQLWATFLGVSSAALAAMQYAPQISHTFRLKLVGALSIPMMCLQTPGAVLMVLSIALRPGTDWTSESPPISFSLLTGAELTSDVRCSAWISYAVAGVMQGVLLVMCLVFRARQHAAGLDDFGRPLHAPPSYPEAASAPPAPTPALEAAVGDVVRAEPTPVSVQEEAEEEGTHEASPLLPKRDEGRRKGLFRWLKR